MSLPSTYILHLTVSEILKIVFAQLLKDVGYKSLILVEKDGQLEIGRPVDSSCDI